MRKTFHLVPDNISADTVEALEELLAEARKGEIIGIAFAVMAKRKKCFVNTAGEARNSPIFIRGLIQSLDDELSERITRSSNS